MNGWWIALIVIGSIIFLGLFVMYFDKPTPKINAKLVRNVESARAAYKVKPAKSFSDHESSYDPYADALDYLGGGIKKLRRFK